MTNPIDIVTTAPTHASSNVNSSEFQADKSQNFQYANKLFRCIADQSFYSSDLDYYIPEHWHEDLEYLVVLDGTLNYNINGQNIVLNKGEGICVNSKRIHSNNSPKGAHCLFFYVILSPSYLCATPYIEQKYVEPVIGPKSFDYLLLKEDSWTKPILDELFRMMSQGNNDAIELEIIEVSFRVLRFLYNNMSPEIKGVSVSPIYDESFKSMLSYIHENYANKVSLDDIARAGKVGKTLCAKLFKKFTSQTPGDYLIHYRVSKGMELINEGRLSITEIAYAVGFTSASHFTKTFRQLTGTTPNKFKNLQ